jgi:hypothetical protein
MHASIVALAARRSPLASKATARMQCIFIREGCRPPLLVEASPRLSTHSVWPGRPVRNSRRAWVASTVSFLSAQSISPMGIGTSEDPPHLSSGPAS